MMNKMVAEKEGAVKNELPPEAKERLRACYRLLLARSKQVSGTSNKCDKEGPDVPKPCA